MKITIEQAELAEPEIIIRGNAASTQVQNIIELFNEKQYLQKMFFLKNEKEYLFVANSGSDVFLCRTRSWKR